MIKTLRELWNSGLPTSRIAINISMGFGQDLSRNSVIGKAYRLDLPSRKPGAHRRKQAGMKRLKEALSEDTKQ